MGMKPEILVKAFVLHQSEDAFRELVARTADEVYSCAIRIVQGPPHLVEEVVLRVYWELARTAPGLGEDVVLANWLREHTCKTAVRVLHEEDRPVDRAALKQERRKLSPSNTMQAAPPGLAMRVTQSILLNNARTKSVWRGLPRALWPAWIRTRHISAGALCVLGIFVLWHIPFHRRNPIIQSPDLEMTPASFGQLATSESGAIPAPPAHTPNTNAESNPNQP